jgi:prepilin-type N-terminal cleavage/methylation domain-containing protein
MRRQRGFTLVEVMVSIAILSVMMILAWSTVSQTLAARQRFGAIELRNREARSALARIVRDLEMAYLSGNEDRSQTDTRTYFVGEASGDVQAVRFSAFAHMHLYADATESDQTVIAYFGAPDPVDRRMVDLMRKESRRMSGPAGGEKWDALPGETEPIFTGITKLKLAYWDPINQEWKESWNTQSVDQGGMKLPDRVRVQLSYLDENGKEITLTSQARIYMQELLQFYAN